MSIASELSNLAANRDAIKAAIEAKNPSVAPTDALSSFPASIASISGGVISASPVAAMFGWPDIKALLEADTEDFAHKAYVLFDALAYPTVSYICGTSDLQIIGQCSKAITSDGSVYTSNSTHTWDMTNLIDGRYGWIAFYSASKFSRMTLSQSYSPFSAVIPRVLWIVGNTGLQVPNTYGFAMSSQYMNTLRAVDFADGFAYDKPGVGRMFFSCNALVSVGASMDLSKCTDVNNMFSSCSSLHDVPSTLDLSSVTTANGMFSNCGSLKSVPATMDFSQCTNVATLFLGCSNLVALPDTINFSSVTSAANQNNAFQACRAVRAMPTHVTTNWSLSFADLVIVTDKDSVCTFSNGSITGGFVGNLNTCPNSGQTITLNSAIKGLFDSTEQSLIAAAMTAKNWTLSW